MKSKCIALATLIFGAIGTAYPAPAAPSRTQSQRTVAVPEASEYPILELRQYTLFENKRDPFIELFDREFVESQEILGSRIFGQFTDIDDPNKFVWLRGFRNMAERGTALNAFYYGPVWKAHREEANPALKDNDDVLFLRAPSAAAAFQQSPPRAALQPKGIKAAASQGSEALGSGIVAITIYHLNEAPEDFLPFFESTMSDSFKSAGIKTSAHFIPELAPNNFPRLKVREGERVLVWFSRYKDIADYESRKAKLESSKIWTQRVAPRLSSALAKPPQVLRLRATPRSSLR